VREVVKELLAEQDKNRDVSSGGEIYHTAGSSF
jgi:hypothetical protein